MAAIIKKGFGMTAANPLQTDSVKTIDEFKEWTRKKIRPIFPHETLSCGYGHLHAGGVSLDYLVTIDYPLGHLQGIRNRAGAIDTPILRRWLATREPQLFEVDAPWPDSPAAWLESFREYDMKNTAAHGVYDVDGCFGTYYSFHRIPGRLGNAHVEALKQLVPVIHEVFCGIIGLLNAEDEFGTQLAGLAPREKKITQWLSLGKTNSEIAQLSGLSENTVKHYMTSIFSKLAVDTRAQLVYRLARYKAHTAPGFGTKVF